MMAAEDRMLVCRDCGREFVFTAGEQAFYAERGFVPPTRCPACRAERRASRGSGDGPGYGASGFASEPRQMFPAVCADCGRETMVPFEPRSNRPVYCRECFQRHRGS